MNFSITAGVTIATGRVPIYGLTWWTRSPRLVFKEFGQRYIPFRVVASAVPYPAELEAVADTNLRESLKRTQSEARTRIEALLAKYRVAPSAVFHEIPEMVVMKWKEGVSVFGAGVTPYQTMAAKLLEPEEAS